MMKKRKKLTSGKEKSNLVLENENLKLKIKLEKLVMENENTIKATTREQIIKELTSNPEYAENLNEILDIYFSQNSDSLSEWQDWFNDK